MYYTFVSNVRSNSLSKDFLETQFIECIWLFLINDSRHIQLTTNTETKWCPVIRSKWLYLKKVLTWLHPCALVFNWAWEFQKRRKCLFPGASESNLRVLLSVMNLAQMDTQIKKLFIQNWFTTTCLKVPRRSPSPLSSQSLLDLIL